LDLTTSRLAWRRSPPAGLGRRWAVISVIGVLLVASCSHAADKAVSIGPLIPTASQPPDPCQLLTTGQVSSAFGRDVAPARSPSPLGVPPLGARDCMWVLPNSHDGYVDLEIETDRSIQTGTRLDPTDRSFDRTLSTQPHINPAALKAALAKAETAAAFYDVYRGTPIAGLGDRAKSSETPDDQAWFLHVLDGHCLLDLDFGSGPVGDETQYLVSAMREILASLSRLDPSPC
jgi:hypothetical protein